MATMPTHITMATYNVVCARGPKLLTALRAMEDINTDIALLTETKLCDERYAKKGHGYTVFATQAPSTQQGGVALVWRTAATHWTLEGMNGEWVCPSSTVARERAGLATIEEYIQRRVNTFLPFIRSRTIYRECRLSQATQAAANHPIWWASHPALAPMEAAATGTAATDVDDGMVPTEPLWWAVAYHADTATEPNSDPDTATTQDPRIDPFLPPRRRSPRRETMIV